MKLSTRVRYGLRAMVELAKESGGRPIPLRKLAENQAISIKYLEQMVASLKSDGLIESVRGAEGGYKLARSADDITVLDIYNSLNLIGNPIDCYAEPCERKYICSTREVWAEVIEVMNEVMRKKTLGQLAQKELRMQKADKS
ncbi:MAG: Rrf2 family transcriptional regulator [Sedimentisphaerales bacterium]|nr:Rrf2 family transcriptional regulator [Sedimentisphaerales bacterium]